MSTVPCLHCSTQFIQAHHFQRYCTDECLVTARNARRGASRRKGPAAKACKVCCSIFDAAQPARLYCTTECRRTAEEDRLRAARKASPKKLRENKPCTATCKACGHKFAARTEQTMFCSPKCRFEDRAIAAGKRNCRRCAVALADARYVRYCPPCQKLNKQESQANGKRLGRERGEAWATGKTHRARAKAYGVPYEPINRLAIYERDGWRCGICAKRIDRKLKHPHPMAVSLDHIIPLSQGGGHLKLNVQAAHWRCNIDKGANVEGAQELLFA